MSSPTNLHWKAVKRILRYLKNAASHGIQLHKIADFQLRGFCDVDYGNDQEDRRSTSGFCVFLGSNLIRWSCKKHNVVSRSSTESEYRSLAFSVAELKWVKSLMTELIIHSTLKPLVYCDNLSVVLLAHNLILHAKTKNMDIDLCFVKEKVLDGDITIMHVSFHNHLANIFTKPLSQSRFEFLRSKLSVLDLSNQPT